MRGRAARARGIRFARAARAMCDAPVCGLAARAFGRRVPQLTYFCRPRVKSCFLLISAAAAQLDQLGNYGEDGPARRRAALRLAVERLGGHDR